jgi:hypothetical protein
MEKQIIDNFLCEEDLHKVKSLILDKYFSWYYNDGKEYADDEFFQFTHIFYNNHSPNSSYFKELQPFLDKLDVQALIRIKANNTGREHTIRKGSYHIDSKAPCKTAIWYLNTNNGKTLFEDGDEVESVENRMVIFPSQLKHTATTHTDTKTRIVINFNYL